MSALLCRSGIPYKRDAEWEEAFRLCANPAMSAEEAAAMGVRPIWCAEHGAQFARIAAMSFHRPSTRAAAADSEPASPSPPRLRAGRLAGLLADVRGFARRRRNDRRA